jgi:hypothetical protein
LRARMRSAMDRVVLVMAWSPEVGIGWRAPRSAARRIKRGDPKAAPLSLRGRYSARHLLETRNSGCTIPTFLGAILNAGYSGASNHSSVHLPGSIRLTVASQKPSNSRFSFQ